VAARPLRRCQPLSASQARHRSTGPIPICVHLRLTRLNLCAFAPLREIFVLRSSFLHSLRSFAAIPVFTNHLSLFTYHAPLRVSFIRVHSRLRLPPWNASIRRYWDLLIYRTLAGLGLGGEFGIGMALAAEAWPAAKRAQASSYVGLGWQFGVLAAALVTPALLPFIGWRGMFLLGLFPAAVAYIIRRQLHEPELFITRAHHQPPLLTRLRMLIHDRETAQVSLTMAILCSVQNFGYYGVMIWLPNYLGDRFGYSLTQSAIWTAVTVAGMIAGILIFGRVADHVGRRPAFVIYMLGAAVLVITYSLLTDAIALLLTGAMMGFFVNGMLGGNGALMSELYPTQVRATAQNVLFNLGRAVGGLGPISVGAVALWWGFPAAIALLALLYLLDLVVLLLFIPEKRGAQLG
jgi:MFS family permease